MENLNLDKKANVGSMFDKIAFRYDFLNHFLSFGIDRSWRRKVISKISENHTHPRLLDVATGTGDLAIAAMKLDPEKINGIDISAGMLEIGREKIWRKNLTGIIELTEGNSEKIPFEDSAFDASMVAFGVRNFADPVKGLSEMARVVRPGGLVAVLEFSKPQNFPFRQLYLFYFRFILPVIGRMVSGDPEAYRYLHDSVMQFPDNEQFIDLMMKAGLCSVRQTKLTGGIASIYTGLKPLEQ